MFEMRRVPLETYSADSEGVHPLPEDGFQFNLVSRAYEKTYASNTFRTFLAAVSTDPSGSVQHSTAFYASFFVYPFLFPLGFAAARASHPHKLF